MTPLKRTTFGLMSLLAIVLLVGVAVVSHLDLNQYKARIADQVLQQTGRPLQINGPLTVSVFPTPGLTLQDAVLGNAEGFAEADFATLESGRFQLQILPLLTGRLKVKTAHLQGLSLQLVRDNEGLTNWDDLMATTAVVETEGANDIVQQVEAGAPVAALLSLGGLTLTDANFSYANARDDSFVAINNLDLSTGRIVLNERIRFDSNFTFIDNTGHGTRIDIKAEGGAVLDLANNLYQLQRVQMSGVNVGDVLADVPVTMQMDLQADLGNETIDIKLSAGNIYGVPLQGEVHIRQLKDSPWLTGKVASGEFNAAGLLNHLGLSIAPSFDDDFLSQSSVVASFAHNGDVLRVRDVEARLGNIDLLVDMQVTNLTRSPVVTAEVTSKEFVPAPWVQAMGWPITKDSLQTARFSTLVRQSGQLLSFNQIELQMDDTTLNGDLEVVDINSSSPPLNFVLALDQLHLDRYLPALRFADAELMQAGFPLAALRQLKLDGELTVDQLTLADIELQNTVLPLTADAGTLEITEAKAEAYTGTLFTSIMWDVAEEESLLTVRSNMNGVSLESLTQGLNSSPAILSGLSNINIDMLTRGTSLQQLFERANGAVSLRVGEGKVSGIDLSALLELSANRTRTDSSAEIEFSELSLTAELTDGVLQTEDVLFLSSAVEITGRGNLNVFSGFLDATLIAQDLTDRAADEKYSVPVSGSIYHSNNGAENQVAPIEAQPSKVPAGIEAPDFQGELAPDRKDAQAQQNPDLQPITRELLNNAEAIKSKLQETLKQGIGDFSEN